MARSYIAGMTLRLARSPEAPKRTTVQGSVTPPYTELERLESPAMVSPSPKLRPVQEPDAAFKTIPQPQPFQAQNAIAVRSDDEWRAFRDAADFPGLEGGHR